MKSFGTTGLTASSFSANTNHIVLECYEITMCDGNVLYWTNYDRQFTTKNPVKTFVPMPIKRSSGIKQSLSLEQTDIDIELAVNGLHIGSQTAFATIYAGYFDSATIKIGIIPLDIDNFTLSNNLDYYMPNDYFLITVGEINIKKLTNNTCDMAVRTYEYKLNTKLPRNLYTVVCPYKFAIHGCGATQSTTNGHITATSTNTILQTDLTATSGGNDVNFMSDCTSVNATYQLDPPIYNRLWDGNYQLTACATGRDPTLLQPGVLSMTFDETLCTQIKVWGRTNSSYANYKWGYNKVYINGTLFWEMNEGEKYGDINRSIPFILDVNANITSIDYMGCHDGGLGSFDYPTQISEFEVFTPNDGLKPYYRGYIRFTSGRNTGLYRTITNYIKPTSTGGVVTVINSFPYTPQIGDHFTIYNACDNTLSDCTAKFSNQVHHRGFAYIPTPEASMQ